MHLTVVHPRYDTRILFKQCMSLARTGSNQVTLLVADGLGDEMRDAVAIKDVGTAAFGRMGRAMLGTVRMWREVRRARPDLVHIHDPELLPLAYLMHLSGDRVVFDMHENLPREILTKEWVFGPVRRLLSAATAAFQYVVCRAIPTIFAEHSYAADFRHLRDTTVVLNFPLLDSLLAVEERKRSTFTVAYIGGISSERGLHVAAGAVELLRREGLPVDALFVGPVANEITAAPAFQHGTEEGWLATTGRVLPEDGWRQIAACHVGIAVLQPSPNFLESYPTKLFEYMALGLPVIVSDFPLWRSVVEDAQCGLLVDPTRPAEVAKAIRWVLEHPREAEEMGRRGRSAAVSKYRWDSEFEKLDALYGRVLSASMA